MISSPYLVPGPAGMALFRELRERNVHVVAMTNSLGSTDEPVVHVGYTRYRDPMLELGVELYEVSGSRVKKNRRANLFGASLGRLHAKLAVVDKKTLFVGSMNLDPRSATINTELGAVIHSPELAREMIRIIDVDRLRSAYRLRLNKDGTACEWVSMDDDDEELVLIDEPDSTAVAALQDLAAVAAGAGVAAVARSASRWRPKNAAIRRSTSGNSARSKAGGSFSRSAARPVKPGGSGDSSAPWPAVVNSAMRSHGVHACSTRSLWKRGTSQRSCASVTRPSGTRGCANDATSNATACGPPATTAATRGSACPRTVSSPKRMRITPTASHFLKPSKAPPFKRRNIATQVWKSSAMCASQWRLKRAADQLPAGQRQRRVAAGREAVDAHAVELQQRREARIGRDRIDRARHLARPRVPAVGAGARQVLEVVAAVLGHRHHETGLHQRARQVAVHVRAAARTVRDHHQPAVAAHRLGVHGQRERQARR